MSKNCLLLPNKLQFAKGHRIPAISGALTVIATGEDVYGLQNDAGGKPLIVTGIEMSWTTTTAFGSAQACPWGLWKVSGFSAIHDTGTGIKTITAHRKRVAHHTALGSVNARMAAAVDLTGDTYTAPDADEPDYVLPTTHSTTPVGSMIWAAQPGGFPLDVLDEHEGYIARPLITMGASGEGNLYISIECHTQEGE